ncbi:hypothetical protein [Pseudoduganella namucuonensis]|uniref:hypothetical protein n=1 Tax=Pseudoduganella namucuonensis TaxID=1035707 RepID=UPI000A95356C|nr:hypothetical protein [Pseudoduganella namucuonensis]
MSIDRAEVQLIANAMYEIRLLLSSYIGSENDAQLDVRVAAHLAYALHNEALALVEGKGFDVNAALRKVAAIDNILQVNEGTRLAHAWDINRKRD